MGAPGLEDGAAEVEREADGRLDGFRRLVEAVAERLGGHPAVVRVRLVMDAYDRAGGGLVAAGLAYTSLLALLPGLLLALAVAVALVRSPADQERALAFIARALPPLEDVARAALGQVEAGAVPTGILAVAGLVWGSSRFYAHLDTAFSRIFRGAPRRNPVVQTLRGVVLVGVLVALPVVLVGLGWALEWVRAATPGGAQLLESASSALGVVSPVVSLIAFVAVVAGCYRIVPNDRVLWRALLVPAVVVGTAIAAFTQVYTFVFHRLVGVAALFGAFVAVFALLAWLSIAYNALLLGAAWVNVRAGSAPPGTGEGPASRRSSEG